MYGNHLYVGSQQSGKTSWALEHAIANAKKDRNPIIVVDTQPAWNFKKWDHAQSVEELISRVWDGGHHTAITPTELPYAGKNGIVMYFEQICAAVRECGNVHLLVDELFAYADARSVPPRFSHVTRSLQHCKSNVYVTTQHYGDFARETFANATNLYVFRTVEETALERLAKKGFDPEELKNLPQGEFKHLGQGFSS